MKYVYGPVPSRRLGCSLGIDVVPYKTCTLDCIYCQLGRTTHKTVERKAYASKDAVCGEIEHVLRGNQPIDYVTFSGSGEPTLNLEIGALIAAVKTRTSLPVVVLTNGTLLFREDVQEDLANADIVMPSLDAASQGMFEKINRPHAALDIDIVIEGLAAFKSRSATRMWLEIMFVAGFNDDPDEMRVLKAAVSKIKPDKIYLNTVVRPPAEPYAKALSMDNMLAVKNYLDQQCEVIAEFRGAMAGEVHNVEEAILEMAKRRPLTLADIGSVLGVSAENAREFIELLLRSGKLAERYYEGNVYYVCRPAKAAMMKRG